MRSKLNINSDGIVLHERTVWFEAKERRLASIWARDSGHLCDDTAGYQLLTFSIEAWRELAAEPDAGEESWDSWQTQHEYVAALFAIPSEEIRVESEGYVGGKSLKIKILVSGDRIDLSQPQLAAALFGNGQTQLLSPLAALLVGVAAEFNKPESSGLPQHARFIAEARRIQARAARIQAGRRRTIIVFDKHFDKYTTNEPARFRAQWSKNDERRVSLNLTIDEEIAPLPVGEFNQGVLRRELSGNGASIELVILDEGTTQLAITAAKHQNCRIDNIDPALLREPISLIPEGVETPRVHYDNFFPVEAYSHRVLGFEPAKREGPVFGNSSGTEWYRKDGSLPTAAAVDDLGSAVANIDKIGTAAAREGAAAVVSGNSVDASAVNYDPQLATSTVDAPSLAKESEVGWTKPDIGVNEREPKDQNPLSTRMRPKLGDVELGSAAGKMKSPGPRYEVPWPILARVLSPTVELKGYQRVGIEWLWARYQGGECGAILADDMGLGKTLQIACLVALAKLQPRNGNKAKRPTLVVAPVILIENWYKELTKFFTSSEFPGRVKRLTAESMTGLKTENGELDIVQLNTFDIVLTNYDSLARHAKSMLRVDWDIVVLDEAHKIKNQGTQVSLAARGLSGLQDRARPRKFDFGICATGTPVENALDDIWALYDFCSPGEPLGSYDDFKRDFRATKSTEEALKDRLNIGAAPSALLRRTKVDVLPSLPGKHIFKRSQPMLQSQCALEEELIRTKGKTAGGVLNVIQNLQRLYQHPWLLDEREWQTNDADAAIHASPKLAMCLDILQEIQADGEKALVFTLWTQMQSLLQFVFEQKLGLKHVRVLNGDPKNRKNAQMWIDEFSNASGFGVMILSPLAAGTGLNIQAANHVIHYGRWWNPAKEDQATDRAYRIGQKRDVQVYYPLLHYPGSPSEGFDVKLDALVEKKRSMARDFLTPADDADLSVAEFNAMVEGAK